MEIEQLRKNANILKQNIVNLLRDFERENSVNLNVNIYHRFLTTEEEMKSCIQLLNGEKQQIIDASISINI